jgi:hypothetical protein
VPPKTRTFFCICVHCCQTEKNEVTLLDIAIEEGLVKTKAAITFDEKHFLSIAECIVEAEEGKEAYLKRKFVPFPSMPSYPKWAESVYYDTERDRLKSIVHTAFNPVNCEANTLVYLAKLGNRF